MDTAHFGFQAMGCACEILFYCSSKNEAIALAEKAIGEVRRLECKYSRYLPESIVSRINAAAGNEAVACDDETLFLIQYADTLFEKSGGLFDITSGVLRKAWDFSKSEVPAYEMIAPLLDLTGWKKVEWKAHAFRLPISGMQIDLGGMVKEYAADHVARLLYESGIRHGYVNMSGDIKVVGPKPGDEPWTMIVRHPRQKDAVISTIPVYCGAMATSGDYERYFDLDGKRYCHIINPKTGYPVSAWQSVTVAAPTALGAGSCATIAMLKEDVGLDFLDTSGMNFLAIDLKGKLHHKN
ncbi:MAG: FAD:protein FMN transferase [Chlorobaculum sp.]|nr:FAD:protein FMN transferase [Chlorobaculum sp.]